MQHSDTEQMESTWTDLVELFSVEDRMRGLSAEERMKGLPAEEFAKQLPVEERMKGLPLEELLKELEKQLDEAQRKALRELLD